MHLVPTQEQLCSTAGEESCDVEDVLYHLRPSIHINSTDAFLVGAPERFAQDTADPSISVSQVLSLSSVPMQLGTMLV